MRPIDLTNQHFGRLTVIRRAGMTANGNARWLCQCSCGNTCLVDGYRLRHGLTKSCGCLRREHAKQEAHRNLDFLAQQASHGATLRTKDGVFYASLIPSRRNKSGCIGVSFDQATCRWCARLRYQKHYVLLKMFDTFAEAVAARKEAEKKYLPQGGQLDHAR